ncbi:hypothetical protein GCK72_018164 [Caenorhabditis remanei]|uniref:Uncharacterized protein n=3 Tax=Caenorhabditis TaxID=6237 RepID=A0A6A5G9C4_CAERE|nr:hypothetical protein GCK72_018164 [Caenorhabditis remanei]KAF1751610.1 hypothetical protein GCK72_018164 [Caenorhabditis remanei]
MLRRFGSFVILFFCVSIFLFPDLLSPSTLTHSLKTRRSVVRQKRNSSIKCVVRPPDPWDQSILEYVLDDGSRPVQLACRDAKVQPELTFLDENGVLHLNSSAVNESGLEVECQYRTYDKLDGDDEKLIYAKWISFNKTAKIDAEFIEVSCQRIWFPRTRVYSNNHNQIKPIPRQSQKQFTPAPKASVIIIVLDSVSHSNFRRTMNKTLEALHTHYGSFIFDGMTKVGDNSFSNAVGFFAGKWWNTEFGDVHGFFDDHELIWKRYRKEGYRTLYSEDYPGFNLFNYLSKGFKKKPVDHYFRPFWLNVYWSYVHRRSKNLCYGNNRMHNLQLNYLSQFISKYKDQPKFAVSWFTELGHDWLNQVRYGDDDIAKFLIKHVKDLEDSYLFVMSDHGHRFDSIRKTSVGRQEERLPFFSISLPKLIRGDSELMETVRNNTKKLTSFFDVYTTFRHILNYPKLPQTARGRSLLLPLQDRNCESANIPEEFCVCETEVPLNVTANARVRTMAQDFVKEINLRLEPHIQCVQLKLKNVIAANLTSPSDAIFEALLLFDPFSYQSTATADVADANRIGGKLRRRRQKRREGAPRMGRKMKGRAAATEHSSRGDGGDGARSRRCGRRKEGRKWAERPPGNERSAVALSATASLAVAVAIKRS